MTTEEEIHKEIQQQSTRKLNKKIVLLAVIAVLAAIIGYFYFGIISPLVAKPFMTKPPLNSGDPITSDHISWVVNELGGYKLHPFVDGEPPEIEVVVGNSTFSVTTENGTSVARPGKASSPDIRLMATYEALLRIFGASDIKSEIKTLYNEGSVTFELLKDKVVLALKGYKGVYDELQGK